MKKISLKACVVACLVAASVSSAVSLNAAEQIQNISAQINYALKVKLNGKDFNPVDTDGTALRPISYNGRTYLPVKAVGEAVGLAVGWDGATNTVVLGENSDWTYLEPKNFYKGYNSFTKQPELLYNGSGTFNNGIVIDKNWVINGAGARLKDLNYSTMRMEIYVLGDKNTITISNYETKEVLKKIDVEPGVVTPVEINIAGISNIEIDPVGGTNATDIVFGNVAFK